jgi:large subunit ribosomal protein L6
MSRVAKAPITVPTGVMVEIAGQSVKVQGTKGSLEWTVHPTVSVQFEDGVISVSPAADRRGSPPRPAPRVADRPR